MADFKLPVASFLRFFSMKKFDLNTYRYPFVILMPAKKHKPKKVVKAKKTAKKAVKKAFKRAHKSLTKKFKEEKEVFKPVPGSFLYDCPLCGQEFPVPQEELFEENKVDCPHCLGVLMVREKLGKFILTPESELSDDHQDFDFEE